MTPTDTLREAVIDAILWSRWNEEGDVRGPEWFVAFKASYDDHHDQAKADADAALSAIEAVGWRAVPVEPTGAMLSAAFGPILHGGRGGPISADFIRQQGNIANYKRLVAAAHRLDATVRGEEG